jgi:tripartite-type tricarboxylate transporter receptor subunit TctC
METIPMHRRCLGTLVLLAVVASAPQVHAQTGAGVGASAAAFPDKPVRVIVPFAPGNTLDAAMRQVGEVFKANTGQPLLIDNKPGGGGLIAAQALLGAPADGLTLLLANTSMLTINPHTFAKLPYDADKSFKPVTNFLGSAMVMAVNADKVPPSNLAEFIAWAKPQGDKISFASFTAGNSSHFAGVILNQRAGLNMVHVPFNGTPPAVQNLVGGQVHAAFLPRLAVKPHVDSGKLKVLAVTSPARSNLMPKVGTFREQGFPDLEIYIWAALVAPAGTPDAVVARLNAEFVRALNSQVIRDQWRAMDFEPLPSTPEEFTRFMQAESKRWAEAVRISGFKAGE